MTRLTSDDVRDISDTLNELDAVLVKKTGLDLLGIACEACNITGDILDMDVSVGVVPITSGLGVITKFSESVAAICRHLGMDAFVTEGADVTGFAEAIDQMPDIIFMADDYQFVGYNTRCRKQADNSMSTAAGYTAVLSAAAGGLAGKEVLIVGAGRVGSRAAKLMAAKGAKVFVTDIDLTKANDIKSEVPGVTVLEDVSEAISRFDLILNASPGHIDSGLIREGAVISSPGVPNTFDEEAHRKATIIHDPLAIGVSVMAVRSASFPKPQEFRCRR